LAYFFDVAEGVFPPEVVTGLVETYAALLHALCESADNWAAHPLTELLPQPSPLPSYRIDSAATERLMHAGAVDAASSAPSSIAVVNDGTRLSYADLEAASRRAAAHMLRRVQGSNMPPRELVVVVLMEKGWRQAVASLACLRAQGAYLPMDPKLPEQRQQHIVQASGASLVMVDSVGLSRAPWLRDRPDLLSEIDMVLDGGDDGEEDYTALADLVAASDVLSAKPSSLAYLIYTSGSTGLPKGVRCHHQGAMNTIQDLNSAFGVGPRDRVLALSSLSFDLSVYDFFGMFEAGATVVMPTADAVNPPDPARWLELVRKEGVTVWNTVPRFMELLVSHVEQSGENIPASLRLVFLSGDFIPLTLPGRIRTACACADVRIVSMGGATEAAVWSNIFEITQTPAPDPSWSSVPYGRPMRNQRMYVLNEAMEHCAPWVTGVLYIGGLGTALGYQGDAERTAYQFVKHPKTGEYLFRTGDLGRVRPWRRDGGGAQLQLEILGREDAQVKVGGHRVELGEIERVLEFYPAVDAAVAAVQGSHLVAFVRLREVTAGPAGGTPAEVSSAVVAALQALCSAQLPPYMVPRAVAAIAAFPHNVNGKVDRGKLPALRLHDRRESGQASGGVGDESGHGEGGRGTAAWGPIERAVRGLFAEALRVEAAAVAADASFFALGGDSLSALFLLRRLAQAFPPGAAAAAAGDETSGQASGGVTFGAVSVGQLFSGPTVRGVAAVVLPSHGPNAAAAPAGLPRRGQLQLVELQPGAPTSGAASRPPLVLVHAAGASGLSYRALAAALDPAVRVFAVDDASLSGAALFAFASIAAAAAAVVALLVDAGLAAAAAPGALAALPRLHVGGWSYGGVVALEVARLLQPSSGPPALATESAATAAVFAAPVAGGLLDGGRAGVARVELLVLFDAPVALEGDAAPPDLSGGNAATPAALAAAAAPKDGHSGGGGGGGGGALDQGAEAAWGGELATAAAAHFAACVALLAKHRTPYAAPSLQCPVVSFRPTQEELAVGAQAAAPVEASAGGPQDGAPRDPDRRLRALTTGTWDTVFVGGDHWSLLFPPHTTALARNLQAFLDNPGSAAPDDGAAGIGDVKGT
jgi:amino acid adenylation domain-containing protein